MIESNKSGLVCQWKNVGIKKYPQYPHRQCEWGTKFRRWDGEKVVLLFGPFCKTVKRSALPLDHGLCVAIILKRTKLYLKNLSKR